MHRRSLLETSALLPTETKLEMPRSSARTWSRTAIPSAPLCESMPMFPAGGQVGAKVAFSETAGSVLSTPRQFGPTMRIPEPRTRAVSRCCAARPSADASAKPDEITTTPRTPAPAQSWTPPPPARRRPGQAGRDHAPAADAGPCAVLDHALDRRSGHGDHREIDRLADGTD